MIDLSYPIGRFQRPESISQADLAAAIEAMAVLPAQLRATVAGWTDEQLDTPYRPDGWTVRQVIHHLPDSHINSYVRYRLALTEWQPTIKPYDEDAWANLPDAQSAPVDLSLAFSTATRALGGPSAFTKLTSGTYFSSPRERVRAPGYDGVDLRMARQASPGAHHTPAGPNGMVTIERVFGGPV